MVKRTEKDKESAYAIVGQLKKQLADRRQYLEEVIVRKRELVEKKREILDVRYTAEERANKMDKLYLDEQEREMALNSELKSTSERMYKITQEIFDHKSREKNLEADINGSVVTVNNLQAKTNKLDHEALKQQEVLYHQVIDFHVFAMRISGIDCLQDFEIQSLERRINRMQGEKSTEEQAMLERKIIELEEQCQRKRDDHIMLRNQTKQIEEEKRRLQKYLSDVTRDKNHEKSKIEELELHDENAQRLLRKLNDEKEVRSRVPLSSRSNHRLSESDRGRATDAYRNQTFPFVAQFQSGSRDESRNTSIATGSGETKRRTHTHAYTSSDIDVSFQAVKERRSEVSIHQSTLRQQLRDEERKTSEISAQLHDSITNIEKLKKKFEQRCCSRLDSHSLVV